MHPPTFCFLDLHLWQANALLDLLGTVLPKLGTSSIVPCGVSDGSNVVRGKDILISSHVSLRCSLTTIFLVADL